MHIRILLVVLLFYASYSKAQTADFLYQLAGSTICAPAAMQFRQNCTGSPLAFIWNNGSQSYYEPAPLMTFKSAGTYNIQLKVVYRDTAISVTKTVVIQPALTASVVTDRNFMCKPGSIDFAAYANDNIKTYTWNFNDGSTPFTSLTNAVSHYYADSGSFVASLNVTSANGCMATAKAIISIKAITVTGTSSNKAGCTPINLKFNAYAAIPAKSSIVNFAWNFNDGTPVINTIATTVTKTISSDISFTPVLTVTTSEGCTGSYQYPVHNFGSRPADVLPVVNKTTDCASAAFTFSSRATNATNYLWFFDNNLASASDTSIAYTFNKLGAHIVKFTPVNYGCRGITHSLNVNTVGVIADFTFSNTCGSKNTFLFTDSSQGNGSSFHWRFFNVLPDDSGISVIKTFPSFAQYGAVLEVTDNATGCKSLKSKAVFTTKNTLVSAYDTICKNSINTFNINGAYSSKTWSYDWHLFNQIHLNDTSASKQASTNIAGSYKNYAVINYGNNYCPDTVWPARDVIVHGPQLNISAPSTICFSDSFKLINKSSSFIAGDSINNWQWDFGDNTGKSSLANPPAYLYKKPGVYPLKLFAADNKGCSDSLKFDVTVKAVPFLKILNTVDTVCLGNADTLIAISNDSIRWQPVNLFLCTNCDTVVIKPTQSQRIYASAGINSCQVMDSMEVKVFLPFKATTTNSEIYFCPNETVQLNVQPADKKVLWSPATGVSNINLHNPNVKPLASTVYTATLADSVNCFTSRVQVQALVKNAAYVDAGNTLILPYNTSFNFSPVYSKNIVMYAWSPPVNIDCANCALPGGKAINSTLYTVKVTSDSGCIASDTVRIIVQCSNASLFMATAFTPNSDNLNDLYHPLVKGVKKITRFAIYNRFGETIFEARDFVPGDSLYGWNGKYKGIDQPASNYEYSLDAICEQGERIQKKGTFMLMR